MTRLAARFIVPISGLSVESYMHRPTCIVLCLCTMCYIKYSKLSSRVAAIFEPSNSALTTKFFTHCATATVQYSTNLHSLITIHNVLNENHRYLKKSRLLKFCYVAPIGIASSKSISAAPTNSTNHTNKAGCT
jgi:hypothetical protein